MANLDLDKLYLEYKTTHKPKCYALGSWLVGRKKPFHVPEVVKFLIKETDGNFAVIDDIISQMHESFTQRVRGRSQVYATEDRYNRIDIIQDENGEFELIGYNVARERPIKGVHRPTANDEKNKVFRKRDEHGNDNVSKVYLNSQEKIEKLGVAVREMYPNFENWQLTQAMQAIKNYADNKKIAPEKIINRLKRGTYELRQEFNPWKVLPKRNESANRAKRTIIINESDLNRLYDEMKMTEHKFFTHIKNFIATILQDPINAQPSDLLKFYGYKRSVLLQYLEKYGLLVRQEKISDKDENGNPKTATMMVKFRCPKKNFERKLEKLYIRMFQKNLPQRNTQTELTEDGSGGATACSTIGSFENTAFVTPIAPVQRRKIYGKTDEATATTNTGEYEYTVPFGGDKETLARKNGKGGSVSINKI